MNTRIHFTLTSPPQKKVAVISHERSGTHFLMNTLALNFNYVAWPWWNLDSESGVNLGTSQSMLAYLQQAHNIPIGNILKSHHAAPFFSDIIHYLLEQFSILYVCRDPRNVMVSFWQHINELEWDAGPKVDTVSQFIRCTPRGDLLRYQKNQEENMLERWATHVNGWLDLSRSVNDRIRIIRYEDLDRHYEETVRDIGAFLNLAALDIKRPDRDTHVIGTGTNQSSRQKDVLTGADRKFFQDQVGVTIKRLGY